MFIKHNSCKMDISPMCYQMFDFRLICSYAKVFIRTFKTVSTNDK